jgi:hypothetical protein
VKQFVAIGFAVILGVELMMLVVPDRRLVLVVAGAVGVVVVVGVRWYLRNQQRSHVSESSEDPGRGLRRWLARTETLIERSESTRADWDRHLRPMLARQFEMATGQRRSKDSTAFDATGRVLFGDELWVWVDPDNLSASGHDEPGPGRGALNDILQRLERV